MFFFPCISEQDTLVIKWKINDEYKVMQIHLFAWKLPVIYLDRSLERFLKLNHIMRRSDI